MSVVDAMGIDKQECVTLDNLEKAMIRAQSRKEILVLHAHGIVDTGSGYTITRDHLKQAFLLSKKHQFTSITCPSIAE